MIEVKFDDIFNQDVEAIVNPANRHMLHGGGLAALIVRKAGIGLLKESQSQVQAHPIDTGESIITAAGKLPFKAVIHTVGPVWEGFDDEPYWLDEQTSRNDHWRTNQADTDDADELLRRAHLSAIKVANNHGVKSLAFPAVSCGVFRFPVKRAAPIAIQAIRDGMKEHPEVNRVVICLLDDLHYAAFDEANMT